MNNYNKKALNDIYKNAHIALQSISDILPSVKDKKLKTHLKEEYEGYDKCIKTMSSYMLENGISPKDINPFKKAMLWTSIKTKTLFNNSKNQISKMMINGTVMGINELVQMNNESTNLSNDIKGFLTDLLSLEENYQEQLKVFL